MEEGQEGGNNTFPKGLSLDLNLKERKLERLEHNEQRKFYEEESEGSRPQKTHKLLGHDKVFGFYTNCWFQIHLSVLSTRSDTEH